MNRPSALVFFSIGAVVDVVFGLVNGHSFATGVIAIICGLPLTALLFFLFKGWSGSNDHSDGRGS